MKTLGYAAGKLLKKLAPVQFDRQPPGAEDLELELLYCGVCHSDVHQVRNDWHNTVWPCVPGHELVGRVVQAGASVKNFKVGDLAAVGCMIDSCGTCPSCREGNEQYCESDTAWLATYNGTMEPNGQNTYGGYSDHFVVREKFALNVPAKLDVKAVGPILCAGVTTYSPLKHFGIKGGQKVGIIGLGGLGHMAVQIARAMGAEVSVFTTSPNKEADARRFGASRIIVSTEKEQMESAESEFDLLLDTIPEKHDINPYVKCLKRDGRLVIVGVLVPEPGFDPQQIIMQRRSISGSLIGSLRETQEVLDFCAEHAIAPQVEVIKIEDINDVYKKIENKEARYRYVVDIESIRALRAESPEKIEGVSHRLNQGADRKQGAA